MSLNGAEIAAELGRRGGKGRATIVGVARRTVDLLFEIEDAGHGAFPLVRAFSSATFSEPSDALREHARRWGDAPEDRCLFLVATRGRLPEWNDVEKSAAHRVLSLSPSALGRDPMVAEIARRLDLAAAGPSPASMFHVPDAHASAFVDPSFARAHDVRSVVGFGATEPTGGVVVVVAFSRVPIDAMTARSFEMVALGMKVALTDTDECLSAIDERTRLAARVRALEEMSAAQRTHAVDAAREVEAEAARRLGERETQLHAENEKARRAQRAILNVIDDLREARAHLEARVEERTRRIEELLGRERSARLEAESARVQAETANRLKDEFLMTVSHELRTPLNAMLGWAKLLRTERFDEDQRANALETIERNARAQVRLIEDLLDLGRVLQGKFRLAVGPVEVVPLVEAALESVRPSAEAKGIRLQSALDSQATILGDGERLQQIAWNLLSNAIKFTPRGGRVLVTLHRAPSYVELVVSDTGQGISADFLPYVFEPFRQADGAISRRTGGLGLGLSIVRSLVELHGGTVTVASDGAGRGATFTVQIPIAPVRASVPPPSSDKGQGPPPEKGRHGATAPGAPTFECPPELAKLRILVVDDEKDTRDLIAFILNACDAIVTDASSADEAVEKLDHGRFDVIVSDIGLPGDDGLAFMRRVRQRPDDRGGTLPAVALTACARTEDRTRALQAGFDVHLAKPVDPSELTLVIAAATRGRR